MLGAPAVFLAALCRYRYSFVSTRLKTSWSYFSPLFLVQIHFGSAIFAEGHFRSHDVVRVFLPKTSYRSELNKCEWSHCVQLAKTPKKWYAFWSSLVVAWPWIRVAQGHALTLNFRCQQIHVSMGLDERSTMVFELLSQSSSFKSYSYKYMYSWDHWSDHRWQPLIWGLENWYHRLCLVTNYTLALTVKL